MISLVILVLFIWYDPRDSLIIRVRSGLPLIGWVEGVGS